LAERHPRLLACGNPAGPAAVDVPYAAGPPLVRAGGIRVIEIVHDHRKTEAIRPGRFVPPPDGTGYAELCGTTNFTFLTGASHPDELVARAAELGLAASAITARNTLAGVVRAWSALKQLREKAEEAIPVRSQHRPDTCSRQEVGNPEDIARPAAPSLPKLIVGARLVLRDSPVHWLALPQDRDAWHRLSRLLTLGKRRAGKG